MTKNDSFFITRKRLAERLAMSGIRVEPCQNFYHPERDAWKCQLTKTAAEVIESFYLDIGKDVPASVREALVQ